MFFFLLRAWVALSRSIKIKGYVRDVWIRVNKDPLPKMNACWWYLLVGERPKNCLHQIYTAFDCGAWCIFGCFFASHWPAVDSMTIIGTIHRQQMTQKRDQCTPSTIFFHPFPSTMSSPWCAKKESEILGDRVETALKPTKYNQSPCITRKLVQVTQLKLETILHVLPNPGFFVQQCMRQTQIWHTQTISNMLPTPTKYMYTVYSPKN